MNYNLNKSIFGKDYLDRKTFEKYKKCDFKKDFINYFDIWFYKKLM